MQGNRHWVGTWAAAPAPAEGVVGFNNHTIRMNPRVSLGGDRIRVRISNAYGARDLQIGAAHVALRDKGPAILFMSALGDPGMMNPAARSRRRAHCPPVVRGGRWQMWPAGGLASKRSKNWEVNSFGLA